MSDDLQQVFKEDESIRRWRAECENASARLDLAKMRQASATLLSRGDPISALGMNRDHLRMLLAYVAHGDLPRLLRDVEALGRIAHVYSAEDIALAHKHLDEQIAINNGHIQARAETQSRIDGLSALLAEANVRLDEVIQIAGMPCHLANNTVQQLGDIAAGLPVRPATTGTDERYDRVFSRADRYESVLREIICMTRRGADKSHAAAHRIAYAAVHGVKATK